MASVLFMMLFFRGEVKEGLLKHRRQFSCKFYILITRSHLEPIARKRKHQGKETLPGASSCAPVFDYAECEVLQKVCAVMYSGLIVVVYSAYRNHCCLLIILFERRKQMFLVVVQ